MSITPVRNFILLREPEGSSIILPDKRNLKMVDVSSLIVCKVGPNCKKVKVGDRLIVDINAVAPFKFEDKQYFLTREDNVGCIIR